MPNDVPPVNPTIPPQTTAPQTPPAQPPVNSTASPQVTVVSSNGSGGNNKMLMIIGIVVVLLLLVGGGAYWLVQSGTFSNGSQQSTSTQNKSQVSATDELNSLQNQIPIEDASNQELSELDQQINNLE